MTEQSLPTIAATDGADEVERAPVAIPTIAEHLRLLTEEQAAELAREHVQTWRRRRRARLGPPFVLIGSNRVRYRVGDLQAWQEQRRAG